MKKFPILVEKTVPQKFKNIDWMLHNVCNYNCSFCIPEYNDGSQRWFSLEEYKAFTDKIVDACEGEPFWIQLTGGEPTLFPELLELLVYIKSKGGMVSIITNGSRTYRWWKEAHEAKVLDALTITYHTEQSKDYQHVVDVLNLFHDDPTDVVCLITHTLDTLEFAFEAQDYIYNNTGALVFMKSMVLPGIDVYQYYTEEQLNKLKTLSRTPGIRSSTKKQPEIPKELRITQYLNVTYNDGSLETLHSQEFMKTRQNMFYGWSCDIGKKNMRIEYDNIRSAVCVSTKEQHLQDPSISFEPNTVTCPVEECKCAMQLIARKSIPNNT